eukprot:CAMPEP_0185841736 /NCGR_PEP_ID=MMETSP1353-20130828/18051_1 /TAXON_ID=1077150 /ORGANISM="Erythrolobus australicus, Strain CCMP3124" /LENGTH=258 /DNA_ID=CAMNT_0028541223 /DNA_START=1425 /DNA_END=2202 /DNA_ORIENTATION=-
MTETRRYAVLWLEAARNFLHDRLPQPNVHARRMLSPRRRVHKSLLLLIVGVLRADCVRKECRVQTGGDFRERVRRVVRGERRHRGGAWGFRTWRREEPVQVLASVESAAVLPRLLSRVARVRSWLRVGLEEFAQKKVGVGIQRFVGYERVEELQVHSVFLLLVIRHIESQLLCAERFVANFNCILGSRRLFRAKASNRGDWREFHRGVEIAARHARVLFRRNHSVLRRNRSLVCATLCAVAAPPRALLARAALGGRSS